MFWSFGQYWQCLATESNWPTLVDVHVEIKRQGVQQAVVARLNGERQWGSLENYDFNVN